MRPGLSFPSGQARATSPDLGCFQRSAEDGDTGQFRKVPMHTLAGAGQLQAQAGGRTVDEIGGPNLAGPGVASMRSDLCAARSQQCLH